MRRLIMLLLIFTSLIAAAQTTTTSYSCKVAHAGQARIFKGHGVSPITLKVNQVYPIAGSLGNQLVTQIDDCLYLVKPDLVNVFKVSTRYVYPMPRFPQVPKAIKDSVKIKNKLLPPFLAQ